jgi:hypothetical protein
MLIHDFRKDEPSEFGITSYRGEQLLGRLDGVFSGERVID